MAKPTEPPIYFWREHEKPYGFMSQWYESAFEVEGQVYQSAEMWMMVQKALLFGDEDIASQMLRTKVPAEHQALGRKARGFERGVWDEHKFRIVEEGNYHKFTKCKDSATLKRQLVDTRSRELVEASPKDRIWGIGFGAAEAEGKRGEWGENLLGKALMNVRGKLREEGEKEQK